MTEHTQGPLHVGGDGTIIYDKAGWGVASATVFHGRQEPGTAQANARRIVACVNALQHVSTEQLETGELLHVSQRMVDAERQRDLLAEAIGKTAIAAGIAAPGVPLDGPTLLMLAEDVAGDHKRLTAQRDALLAALERAQGMARRALSQIGDIRHGQNVTSIELWAACEHLENLIGAQHAAIAAAKAGAA